MDLLPCSRSGYYWIFPRCAIVPIRVYCDFKSTVGNSYAYWGKTAEESSPNGIHQLKSIDGARYICAELGL